MTEILIKRLSKNIPLPKYETDGSSGMDISADVDDSIEIKPGKSEIIPTGLAVSIPKNFEIQIRPRSGLAAKNQISVLNTPGTIDADYRGELKIILFNRFSSSLYSFCLTILNKSSSIVSKAVWCTLMTVNELNIFWIAGRILRALIA